ASFALPLAIPVAHRLIKGARPIFDGTFALMSVYLLILLVSAFGAVDWRVAALQIATYVAEGLALYWLLVQAIRTRTVLRCVMWTVVLTGALLGSLSLYQQVTGDYATQFGGLAQRQLRHDIAAAQVAAEGTDFFNVGVKSGTPIKASHRAAGPFGDPNRFAQILLVALPWAVFLAYRSKARYARVMARLTGAIILAGIGVTYSRGAFLTIALLLVGLSFLRLVRPMRIVAGAAVAALVVLAFAPNYVKRMGTILDTTAIVSDRAGVNPDGAIKGRATEVLAALWVFADHPFLGVGPGQYVPFYSQSYQQRAEIKFRQLSVPREAHNLYVSIAAETGVVGLLVFLAIFISLIVRLTRARHYWLDRDSELAYLAIALQFSLFAYLGTGVFLHMAYERYQALLLGVVGAALQIMHMEMMRRRAVSGGDPVRAE
ncbi:MAG TPA: O-antigen ligase family protein, partial [Vicinamibacterales bacterium]|nr:O-antigen ligase family protein [Vicinamibacterales bacterium]